MIARRQTLDGITVHAHEDGSLTDRIGNVPPGAYKAPRSVLFLVLDELAIVTWDEIPTLIKAARKLVKSSVQTPQALRSIFDKLSGPSSTLADDLV